MARLIIVALLLFVRPALAADPWTKAQVGQQVAFTALCVADWGQTLDIKNHPNLYEGNSVLGTNPTDSEINTYFSAACAGHALVAHLLPSRKIPGLPLTWRDAWQHVWIAREAYAVGNNYSLGVKFDF